MPEGVCQRREVCAKGGCQRGVCARGGVCQRGCARGVCARGGCARGGVPEGGGWVWQGMCVPEGGIPACTEADTPPPVNRMTNSSKNITLATTSLRPVINRYRQRHQSLMIGGGNASSSFFFIVHVDCYQIINRADPRFSIEGGANSEGRGANVLFCKHF